MSPSTIGWIVFNALLLFMLFLDLRVFHRRAHAVELRESLTWVAVWVTLALLFNAGLYAVRGPQIALEFFTAYLIEYALSADNLFVFLMLFGYFRVPARYQHKVLFWGILGALVMRLTFVLAGVALLHRFHWLIYLFGAILVVSGVRMLLNKDKEIHPEANPVLRLFRRAFPVTPDYEEDRFFVRRGGLMATPLFVVLLAVETTDVVFAVDSVPAVLAITRDPFIAYTSNAFAILGLRALFFTLSGVMRLFHFLHYGLSAILVFVGTKMMISDFYKIPVGFSLGVVVGLLAGSILASIAWPRRPSAGAGPPAAGG